MAIAAVLRAIHKIQARLESEKHRIYEEIKHYPRPIPACDVQFNALLEERAKVLEELDRLRACGGSPKRLAEFVRTSAYLDDETEREYLGGLAGPGGTP